MAKKKVVGKIKSKSAVVGQEAMNESQPQGPSSIEVQAPTPNTAAVVTEAEPISKLPTTSPYVEAPIGIKIGGDKVPHYVPRCFLPSHWDVYNGETVSSHAPSDQTKPLIFPNIDMDTGHTLIHYLYTGTYQTLANPPETCTANVSLTLKRALKVYIMTVIHDLPNLGQLAIQEFEGHSEALSILEILRAIKYDFPIDLQLNWLHELLFAKMKLAFDEDYTIFNQDDFFYYARKKGALGKFCMKVVMDLYTAKISNLVQKDKEMNEEHKNPEELVEQGHSVKAAEKCPHSAEQVVLTKEDICDEACVVPEACDTSTKSADGCTVSVPNSACLDPTAKSFHDGRIVPSASSLAEPVVNSEAPELLENSAVAVLPTNNEEAIPEEHDPWGFFHPSGSKKSTKKVAVPIIEPEAVPTLDESILDALRKNRSVQPLSKKERDLLKVRTRKVIEWEKWLDEHEPIAPPPDWDISPARETLPYGLEAVPTPAIHEMEEAEPIPDTDALAASVDVSSMAYCSEEPLAQLLTSPEAPYEETYEILSTPTSPTRLCPFRAKHMLDADAWKTCKPCLATVRQIAVQLARGHIDEIEQKQS